MLTREQLGAEDGFTLIELLTAMVIGLVVMAAALAIVSQATSLTASAQNRVDAAQRARRGVEDLVTELRSGVCVPLITTTSPLTVTTKVPMISGDGTSISWYANLGTENALPEKRVLSYSSSTGRITETRYAATGTSTATAVSFSTTGTTRTVLENVVPYLTTPIFTYSKYTVDTTVTPAKVTGLTTLTSLAAADLPFVVAVNVSLRVPSRSGSALTDGAEMTVRSGSKLRSSSALGRMKRLRANRLCQASSVTTRTRMRCLMSAHAKTSWVKTSWLSQNSSMRWRSPSNLAGAMGWFAAHQIAPWLVGSFTKNLSFGERPVC